ncbi:hypothetical protein BIU82_10790 [Arthrobacter sp. SW1]|uniref:hypothetical protein n=1 Tax=Arthrobacter sp. SW1 TaxID=1920889 RepID=UPI000877C806|nr:hypothetical protein [Arthrobacter sp. SW1]OFI36907.1 hypothetical protein BIU82_10790 [Arthrobacter sp. SW1]
MKDVWDLTAGPGGVSTTDRIGTDDLFVDVKADAPTDGSVPSGSLSLPGAGTVELPVLPGFPGLPADPSTGAVDGIVDTVAGLPSGILTGDGTEPDAGALGAAAPVLLPVLELVPDTARSIADDPTNLSGLLAAPVTALGTAVNAASSAVPGATAPGATVPGGSTPGATVPGGTAPGATTPGTTVPGGSGTGGAPGTAPGSTGPVPGSTGTVPGSGSLPGAGGSTGSVSGGVDAGHWANVSGLGLHGVLPGGVPAVGSSGNTGWGMAGWDASNGVGGALPNTGNELFGPAAAGAAMLLGGVPLLAFGSRRKA